MSARSRENTAKSRENTAKRRENTARSRENTAKSRENTAKSRNNSVIAETQRESKPGSGNSGKSNRTGAQFDDVISLPSIVDEEEQHIYQREPTPRRRKSDADHVRSPDARASYTEQRPPCSCIPALSSKNVSSMVYDKIHCKHMGHKGGAHRGVVFFNDNWGGPTVSNLPHINNIEYHQNRPEGKREQTRKTANAYPRGEYISSESEGSGTEYETDSEEEEEPEVKGDEPHLSARSRDNRVSILESRRHEPRAFTRQSEEAHSVIEDTVDMWTDFDYTEGELERKYVHNGKVLDPATGKIMRYKIRSDARSGKFDRQYDNDKITNGGYITAKLDSAS